MIFAINLPNEVTLNGFSLCVLSELSLHYNFHVLRWQKYQFGDTWPKKTTFFLFPYSSLSTCTATYRMVPNKTASSNRLNGPTSSQPLTTWSPAHIFKTHLPTQPASTSTASPPPRNMKWSSSRGTERAGPTPVTFSSSARETKVIIGVRLHHLTRLSVRWHVPKRKENS